MRARPAFALDGDAMTLREALCLESFDARFKENFERLLTWRRDVRSFRSDPVPDRTLEHLLSLACLAPSVGLSQPWRFVTVRDPARRTAIRTNFLAANEAALRSYDGDKASKYARLKLSGLDEAPVHLAVFAEPEPEEGSGLGRQSMPETVVYSVVTAIHTLWLAARAEGIGMGWVSILDPSQLSATLDVPEHWLFLGYFCLGYPKQEADSPELERCGWERRTSLDAVLIRR